MVSGKIQLFLYKAKFVCPKDQISLKYIRRQGKCDASPKVCHFQRKEDIVLGDASQVANVEKKKILELEGIIFIKEETYK